MNLLKDYLKEKKRKSMFGWVWYYPLKWLIRSASSKSMDAESKFSYTLY